LIEYLLILNILIIIIIKVYHGLSYKLSLKFPVNYPYTAPTIKFTTPCFHPNVDSEGNICLDILKVNILKRENLEIIK